MEGVIVTELGNRLKEARLSKGLSLDDLQAMTKIQKRYLTGIEEGNYSSMPGNFYARAFIRQYAEAVQLNPEEIFETYKSEIPATQHDELPEHLSRVKTHKQLAEPSPKVLDLLPKILIGIVAVGIVALIYYFFSQHADKNSNQAVNNKKEPAEIVKSDNLKNDEKKKDTKPKAKKKDTTKENTTPPAAETPKQDLAVVQSAGSKSTYELKNADAFVVKVVSKGQTWVNIKNGKGYSFFQGMLKAGETQSKDLTKESEAVIVVGRTIDTEIYVNDQKLEYAVPPASVVRQDITVRFVPKQ
jgi:cytoskeletal protein RodZ